MCEIAIVRLAGREPQRCNTCGELSKILDMRPTQLPQQSGRAEWRLCSNLRKPTWNECLCHIDFEALAKMRGMTCHNLGYEDLNCGEWELSMSESGAPVPSR